MNHQIAPVGGWYRVNRRDGGLPTRVWVNAGELVSLASGESIERDDSQECAHTILLSCAELDAVAVGLAWASQLKRAAIDSALDKVVAETKRWHS